MLEEHYRKLEWMYVNGAPINKFYQPKIDISKGECEITIEISPKFFHAANAVHGSVYFKMLDDAAFFAANSLVEEVFVLTTSFHIHLMRPVIYGQLKSIGKIVSASKKSFVAEAILYNEKGQPISKGSGTFVKSDIILSEEIGYK